MCRPISLLVLSCAIAPLHALAVAGAGSRLRHQARVPAIRCALAEERTESAKAGAIAAVSGSLCSAPAALLASTAFTPQWEFATDALAVDLLLFGVVYRYAVRSDDNDMLKQGAVGAFALVRTLSSVRVGDQCSALPLNCVPSHGLEPHQMQAAIGARCWPPIRCCVRVA